MSEQKQDDAGTPSLTPKFFRFDYRSRDLADAELRHDMVASVTASLTKAGASGLARPVLAELWQALAGRAAPSDAPPSPLESAVESTAPRGALLLVRGGDDMPCAAAYVIAARALVGVDMADDYALRQAFAPVWAKLAQLDDEAKDAEEGFGCNRADAWRTVRKVREVSTPDFAKKMLEIARLAGHMHSVMSSVAGERDTDDPHEVRGVSVGRDVARLMPTEHARLADPATADATAMRVLKGQAEVQQLGGRREATRGALVLLLDESGSMHDEAGRTGRNTWAKAAALALARIALKDGRAVVCGHWSTGLNMQRVRDQDDLLEMCASFQNGGTTFLPALREGAKEALGASSPELDGADVVVITDGELCSSEYAEIEKVLDGMDAAGTRLWTVGIGHDIDSSSPLRARAKRYVYAHDSQLALRKAAVGLAVALTGAATKLAREDAN